MKVLNLSHPLVPTQVTQIADLTGSEPEVIEMPVSFDHNRPFQEQVVELVDSIGLTPAEWQTTPILVNPPAFNVIAVTLLAELHGRMGYFPPVVRLRPVEGAIPRRFEVAEIIDLQEVRDTARIHRREE